MSLTNDDDCLITSSGFGDGAYPAFWGVDDSDRLVTLYIDFLVLVEEKDDGTLVSV